MLFSVEVLIVIIFGIIMVVMMVYLWSDVKVVLKFFKIFFIKEKMLDKVDVFV